MSSEYSRLFHVHRISTRELQNPEIMQRVHEKGYAYIRKYERDFNSTLRRPTIGCIVEISYYRQVDSVPIYSRAGQKLINRLNYV